MNQEFTISPPSNKKVAFKKETINTSTFKLERNRIQIGVNRLIYGLGIFLLPTLLANAIYASVLELKNEELLIATGITALILFNLAIYLNSRTTKGNRTLIVGHRNIKILRNSHVLHIIPYEDLKITELNWGIDENSTQPAIRIQAKNFPCMTIGSRATTPAKAKSQQIVDCTTFLISDEQQWNNLKKALKNCIQK
jgi:hypothetical protein